MPYIDDSVQKNNSPLYFSFLTSLRLIGPAGGFILSSFSLRFYENPFSTVKAKDLKDNIEGLKGIKQNIL
ncbi:unnamed protein product [Oppiella nova]|uniref:Uncharacterized protein n=1 Tax=Oppiella nova TaxID=334625 RepID=A0A7R9M6K2_9ACAR|nr:unnamed protein product [Oppiella nova]CAG2171723.1 unnamed protein product [Oppiella nova]